MEKFSKWRDNGTGIAPYLPHAKSKSYGLSSGTLGAKIDTPISLILGIVRIPVLLVFLLLHILIFQWNPVCRRLSLSACLYATGVWWWEIGVERIRKSTSNQKFNAKLPKSGDVIISTFTSPLDPLIYSTMYDSIFVIPQVTSTGTVFTPLGLFDTMAAAVSLPESNSHKGSYKLEEIMAKASRVKKVIVVFMEGTTSSGRALLPFVPLPSNEPLAIPGQSKIYPVAIKYNPPNITTPIPTHLFTWAWTLISQSSGWSVRFRVADAVDPASTKDIMGTIAESLTRVGRIRKVGDSLNIQGKRDFVQAWNNNIRKG
ncbi:hypothetical protein NADFUDRAFT_83262 [Nadsonia fulvescens var. elongata DSM 6958]|uniref:Phospholipid/glycerol acyltransferase domain-containing protein n=1 Tax=Nadsonia fulvescens var. elongata DSM 6958 TaxID=857566 RepID=A0A1E3PIE5_9ASCO|nr:hypothetical protein NADFUDRAFT_83262 [Nadsonia fulvescens var. elongata DSM 6958]